MKTNLLYTIVIGTLLVVAAGAQQAGPPAAPVAGTAVIAGRVIAADSGRPIRGAVVRVFSYDVMRVAKSAVTDDQGRYEYSGLVAGQYQLSIMSADGYLALQFGQTRPTEAGKPIDLRAGERLTTADFSLPRTSAIEGIVVDEFGDPAPNVRIDVSQVQFVAGSHRLMNVPEGSRRLTDDRGHYRLPNLGPGQYYVGAAAGVFTDPNAAGGFAATFYPGTTEASAAKTVRLQVGQDVTDVSFALVPARMTQVSGTLVNASGQPVTGSVMLALSDRGTLSAFLVARGVADASGNFIFRNVPPGDYVLQGFESLPAAGSLSRLPFGWLSVRVAGDDQTGLVLRVAPGAVARGRIVFEGGSASNALTPNDVRVGFTASDFDSQPVGGGPPDSSITQNWNFSVSNQFGRRVIRLDIRSAEWTVKRVTLNERDVTDVPLDFRNGDINGLEVVVTTAVASVGGSVVDLNRRPVSSYNVIVFAADTDKWPFPSRFVQLARPNQDGHFKASGLPPERYLAVAVATVQGAEWQDPEFLQKLRVDAVPVTILEGGSQTLELRLVQRPD